MRKNLKVVTIMEQNQTSWENFFRNDSSNMLEDALPYLKCSETSRPKGNCHADRTNSSDDANV